MTNRTGSLLAAGVLAYDAACAFCVRWIDRMRAMIEARHIRLVPLSTPWVRRRLGLKEGQTADRMWLLLPDGRALGGADAVIEILRRTTWARPLAWIAGLPGIRGLMHLGYGWVARHRHCLGGQCTLHAGGRPVQRHGRSLLRWCGDLSPSLLLLFIVMLAAPRQPAWLYMWLISVAVYAGCKWLMLRRALNSGVVTDARRIAAFLLWPGLDARSFLNVRHAAVPRPHGRELASASLKTAAGLLLFFGITPLVPHNEPLLAGWTAMIGLILTLHFGLFHLLTLAWRARGVHAPQMMHHPLASRSLAEFWGRRWNRDFRVLAHETIFQPMARRIGVRAATALVFLFSGLVHDLVISLPAGGGYGLPTLYFLIQFAGLMFEGSRFGRRLGLGGGVTGWCFTCLITAAPVGLLFHEAFVVRVILPFAQALGAM